MSSKKKVTRSTKAESNVDTDIDSNVNTDGDLHFNLNAKKIDIKLNKLAKHVDETFEIEIVGNDVCVPIVNALRRTMSLYIPVYSFHRNKIMINTKDSKNMYNNDLIYNVIETLPIYDIENELDLESPELYLSDKLVRKIYGSFTEDENNIDNEDIDDNISFSTYENSFKRRLKDDTGDIIYSDVEEKKKR